MGSVTNNEVTNFADGFELYQDKNLEWRWRHFSSGQITAESGESYKNRENCESALENLRKVAASASIRIKVTEKPNRH